jgi:hypothetical protein
MKYVKAFQVMVLEPLNINQVIKQFQPQSNTLYKN